MPCLLSSIFIEKNRRRRTAISIDGLDGPVLVLLEASAWNPLVFLLGTRDSGIGVSEDARNWTLYADGLPTDPRIRRLDLMFLA